MVPGASRESRWLTTSRTLSGLPSSAGGRATRIVPSTTSTAPVSTRVRQSSQTRNGLPAVRSWIAPASCSSSRPSSSPAALRTNSTTSSPERPASRSRTTPSDRRRSASVSRQRLRHVGLGVAEGGEQQNAGVPGGVRQVAQQEERRRVGPVPVLEHEQRRLPARDAGEEVGYGRVQPVALGIRIGLDRRRKLTDPNGQIGEEPRELAASGAERRPQLGRIGDPRQVVECLDERPVRRPHDSVAGAVEDECALSRRLAGELPDKPALARTRFAAEQHDPAALAVGPRHQRAQQLQLGRATDEREGRGEAKRGRKIVHGTARPRR